MSLLPKKKTDVFALVRAGYEVAYTDSKDSFTPTLDLYDCVKEAVTKNGVICSPEDEPAVKYFDKQSGEIVAAAWHNERGLLSREDAPAFVCERSPLPHETGASRKYVVLGYLKNGGFHNTAGAAHTVDEYFKDGKVVRTLEDYYLGGKQVSYIRRDRDTGEIIPAVSSALYSQSDDPEP